jgi:glycosyltransferase involved in cell wall biosynthesis
MSLPGATQDVVPYLAAMDIAVLTSDGESFSNAIIEYLAAGLPVVATGIGGTVEALRESGFLCPPGDLDRLTEFLSKLIADPQARHDTGVKGKLEANRKYSIARMVSAHEEVYTEYLPKQAQSLIAAQK